MSKRMRIYIVENASKAGRIEVFEAPSNQALFAHLSRRDYEIRLATAHDIKGLMLYGAEIKTVGDAGPDDKGG